ncbi:MAG: hypothetical protein QOJ42_611, partial [Acidobacteriaceae bacterium]|nr:hypothetical protein [Acidobacteriaceae bacterium]
EVVNDVVEVAQVAAQARLLLLIRVNTSAAL